MPSSNGEVPNGRRGKCRTGSCIPFLTVTSWLPNCVLGSGPMTILTEHPGGTSRLAAGALVTLQCDVCCPPFLATNTPERLRAAGWTMTLDGSALDVCHICRRRRHPRELVGRADQPELRVDRGGALPNLVVIGAAKCATNSLHAILDSHPDISMSPIKEPQFFQDPDGDQWWPFYKSQFDPSATVKGESSTTYTRYPAIPQVPERMALTLPDAKLIYMVRDPVERAVSSYVEERSHSNDERPFSEAFADLSDAANPYVAASRYSMQLSRYRAVFNPDQVLVVDMHHLDTDPVDAIGHITAFLGVDSSRYLDGASARLNTRSEKREYPAAVRRLRSSPVLRAAYSLSPELRENLLRPARRMLSRRIERPDVPASVRTRLEELLRPEAEDLRRLTGQSFESWSV